jgi:cytochrome c-type biogenesis protein CcmH
MYHKTDDYFVKKITIVAIILFTLLALFPKFEVMAQNDYPTDDQVNAIAKELYCPVCENVSLDVCPTQACAQWRALIREKLIDGWNKEQIKQYFVNQYGDRVLAQPPARGLNWLVYILPPLFFIAGIYLVYSILKKAKKPPLVKVAEQKENQDKYIQEIEEALKSLEKKES